jgi:hypothetical protein
MKEVNKARSLKTCLHPQAQPDICSGGIVRAHSVQERMLRLIARDGHVYGWNFRRFARPRKSGSLLTLIGVNDASTFTGMCGHHDDATFAPIEKQTFAATPEQCFLLGYRAVIREAFVRKHRPALIRVMRTADQGRAVAIQHAIQTEISAFEHGSSRNPPSP